MDEGPSSTEGFRWVRFLAPLVLAAVLLLVSADVAFAGGFLHEAVKTGYLAAGAGLFLLGALLLRIGWDILWTHPEDYRQAQHEQLERQRKNKELLEMLNS